MTLAEIVLDCQAAYGARYQCSTAKILQFINTVQQVAFNRDLLAFLWWEDYLTVYQDVVLSSSGFTPWADADVGKMLSCAAATGTIISYNNATYTAQVSTTGAFSGAVTTLTGTGGGTFASQRTSKGPYSWVSLVPSLGSLTAYTTNGGVRRLIGVTKVSDAQLFHPTTPQALTDYGFSPSVLNEKYFLENIRKYDMQQAFRFIDTPDATANTYRWLYFIRPPTISGQAAADNVNLIIPSEFHETVIKEGVGLLADRSTHGDRAPEQALAEIITPFWNAMQQPFQAMGENANMTSEGTL